ncbi:MAG: hypothetical protein H6966_00020 [Chromatiaceae bacterium]|nr:hypothetical protein [Chromatiaceae bacterium]
MSQPQKKEGMFKSKVIPSLVTVGVVSFIATVIPGGWSWVFSKVRAFGSWLVSDITIPIWVFCLLSLCALAIIIAVVVLVYAAAAGKSDNGVNYTEDTFFGVRWSWRYGQMGIYDLAAFCPDCDLQIYARPNHRSYSGIGGIVYHCEDCHRDVQTFDCGEPEIENRVKRTIQKNLRQKERQSDPATA